MATRYWVLGSGTWDTTTTTNWSTTSGGAGGASAPTSVDDVIFDANSNVGTTAFTVTMGATANCLSFSTGGAGGALDAVMTFNSPASANLNVYGSFTLPASNLTWAPTANLNLNFLSTTTGNTVTTNGIFLSGTFTTFNGVGGDWTFGSAYSNSAGTNHAAGTVNTANYSWSCNSFSSQGALTRTLNLGSSTVTAVYSGGSFVFTSTGLTFNAGTSTLVVSGGGAFTGAGLTFYNVSFTSTTLGVTITGANTYNNMTFASRSNNGLVGISITGNQTINGTLTQPVGAIAGITRAQFASPTIGTPYKITAAAVSLVDCDFRDITGAGAASWTGTRLGDLRGNSGITFDAAKTVYWNVAGSGNTVSSNGWATTPTGTPAYVNFPLPQDIATITDNNPASGAILICAGSYFFGTFDFSARTIPFTFQINPGGLSLTKDFILSSAITVTNASGQISFNGRGITQTVTSAGVTIPAPGAVVQNTIGGTVQFADACVITGAYYLVYGTLSTNYNLTCSAFNSSYTSTRAITFGGNVISLTGTGLVWNTATTTGLTLSAGTSTISLTDNSATARSFSGGDLTYWNLQSAGTTGGSALTLIGNNTFNAISSNKTVAHSILFTAGSTTTLSDFVVSGSAGNLVTISSPTAAFHTLVKVGASNVSSNYLNISYSHAS